MKSHTDPLAKAFVEARDSAARQHDELLAGWRPKSPNENEQKIIALIESMSPDQKDASRLLVRHLSEATLFKLIAALEEGIGPHSFQLSSKTDDSEETHISDSVDHDLIHEFWRWMRS